VKDFWKSFRKNSACSKIVQKALSMAAQGNCKTWYDNYCIPWPVTVRVRSIANSGFVCLSVCLTALISQQLRVSAAVDRFARRSGSAHAKYSVSYHMVIKPFLVLGLDAEYRFWRWVWSTVVWRPSVLYDTHRRTTLSAPETISHSRVIVGVHQNLNGSRDLTTFLSEMVCH